jgi:hypothetical protein
MKTMVRGLLGPKFDKAQALAADLHRQQNRTNVPVPYPAQSRSNAGNIA